MARKKAPRIILYPDAWGQDGMKTHRAINDAAEKAGRSVSSWGIEVLFKAARKQLDRAAREAGK